MALFAAADASLSGLPDTSRSLLLILLEEVLGAVPIDEHGGRLYPRCRRRQPPGPG